MFLVSVTPSGILLHIALFPIIPYASLPSSSQQMILPPSLKKKKAIRQELSKLPPFATRR